MTDEQILEEIDKAKKLGRKQALEEVYEEIRNLANWRIRVHNKDFDNAKDEKYKYDLSRDAREFNSNYNMVLDCIKEKIEAEGEECDCSSQSESENIFDVEEVSVLLTDYIEKHPLAIECGGHYILEDDEQADALYLVCDIFDNIVEHRKKSEQDAESEESE